MSFGRMLLVLALCACAALGPVACSTETSAVNLSTPTEALKTQFTAVLERDVATYKRTLTTATVKWFESEGQRSGKSADELLRAYLERAGRDDCDDWPAQTREEQLADGRVDVWFQLNGRWSFARFAREGDAWKMDGYGWPYKQPPQWIKQSS